MRRRLVLPLEDEAPRLPSLGRGAVSFFRWKARRRLVFQRWGDALPRSSWAGTRRCLVSELLGSFGDNELSPECLDGAQRFLKADGISIPSS
ncbi:hypothetical protein GW17_00014695 [Ensete ventricosum]|nr:hypothetical protein GW17_00014695 [Ensete ventricosum]